MGPKVFLVLKKIHFCTTKEWSSREHTVPEGNYLLWLALSSYKIFKIIEYGFFFQLTNSVAQKHKMWGGAIAMKCDGRAVHGWLQG